MGPIEGRITERDYAAAMRLHLRPRPAFAVLGMLLLGVVFGVLAMTRSADLAFFVVIFALSVLFSWYWRLRGFRQYKALQEPLSVAVRDDGIFFKRTSGEGLVPWDHVIKWRGNDKLVLLYPARHLYYLIPRHFFKDAADFAGLRQMLEERVGTCA